MTHSIQPDTSTAIEGAISPSSMSVSSGSGGQASWGLTPASRSESWRSWKAIYPSAACALATVQDSPIVPPPNRRATMADLPMSVKRSERKSYPLPAMAPRDKGERQRQDKAGITAQGVKKTIWFHEDEAEAL